MKTLKVVLITCVCALGFSPIFAQKDFKQVRSPEERSEQRTEKMAEELDLTPEQATKLATINDKYAKERESLAKENRKKREENRDAMKKLNQAQSDEINNLLTPEQLKKMEEYREQRMNERKENRKEFKEGKMKSDQK